MFQNRKECDERGVKGVFSSCVHVIWCVVWIRYSHPIWLRDEYIWNEINVRFLNHNDILTIFHWIFCKLEIIENSPILIFYSNIARALAKQWTHEGTLFCIYSFWMKWQWKLYKSFKKILSKTFRTFIPPLSVGKTLVFV